MDEFKPSDRLFYAVNALPGWDELLDDARELGGNLRHRVGTVISSILLAGGEENDPVSVAGRLDDAGSGYLFVLYSDLAVLVEADSFTARSGQIVVSVHPLDEIRSVSVASKHTYFDGTDQRPRESGLVLRFLLAGREVELTGSAIDQRKGDAATLAALSILRDRLRSSQRS